MKENIGNYKVGTCGWVCVKWSKKKFSYLICEFLVFIYIIDRKILIVRYQRQKVWGHFFHGVSSRIILALTQATILMTLVHGRLYVNPKDIRATIKVN